MAFAFHDIILNGIPVTYSAGRITLNGSGLAYASEAAGSVTGLTVESGDARYVNITGNETVLGVKTFTGDIIAQTGIRVSGNLFVSGALVDTAGNQSVDPKSYYLISAGVASVDWAERSASDTGGTVSLSWEDRGLLDADGNPSVAWASRQLSGDWLTNTTPTTSGHIINKGYLDSVTGSLGGGVGSDVVRTTGDQNISGEKTFSQNLIVKSGAIELYNSALQLFTDSTNAPACHMEERELYGAAGWSIVDYSEPYAYVTVNPYGQISYPNGGTSLDLASTSLLVGVNQKLNWGAGQLSGDWSTNTTPTQSGHLANKSYVDSNSSFTLGFGHKTVNPADSTIYYFGGLHDEAAVNPSSDASVVYCPVSGVLRGVVGNCFVAGTLGSSETCYLIIYINGSGVATGTYKMSGGKNNIIQSGLQSINRSISQYDSIQMGFSGNWGTQPTTVRHNLNAYITLG